MNLGRTERFWNKLNQQFDEYAKHVKCYLFGEMN